MSDDPIVLIRAGYAYLVEENMQRHRIGEIQENGDIDLVVNSEGEVVGNVSDGYFSGPITGSFPVETTDSFEHDSIIFDNQQDARFQLVDEAFRPQLSLFSDPNIINFYKERPLSQYENFDEWPALLQTYQSILTAHTAGIMSIIPELRNAPFPVSVLNFTNAFYHVSLFQEFASGGNFYPNFYVSEEDSIVSNIIVIGITAFSDEIRSQVSRIIEMEGQEVQEIPKILQIIDFSGIANLLNQLVNTHSYSNRLDLSRQYELNFSMLQAIVAHELYHYASYINGGGRSVYINADNSSIDLQTLHEGFTDLYARQLTGYTGETPYLEYLITAFFIQKLVDDDELLRRASMTGDFSKVTEILDARLLEQDVLFNLIDEERSLRSILMQLSVQNTDLIATEYLTGLPLLIRYMDQVDIDYTEWILDDPLILEILANNSDEDKPWTRILI